jgi:hypothetical protein
LTVDASSTSGCTINAATGLVTFGGTPGSCTIDANQAASAGYTAAPQAQQSMVVGKGNQTITFTSSPPSSPKVGGTYAVTATASSGLVVTLSIESRSSSVCTISSGVVTFVGRGTCVIDANQSGNASYFAAPQARQSFRVN